MATEKPSCPKCDSKDVRTNVDDTRRCRRCGNKWKESEETKQEEK